MRIMKRLLLSNPISEFAKHILTRIVFCAAIISCSFQSLQSQDRAIRIKAPEVVRVGERVQVTYTINDKANEIVFSGQTPSCLKLIGKPMQTLRRMKSTSNVKDSMVFETTYTYNMMAINEGECKIPSVTITTQGDVDVLSNSISLSVLPKYGKEVTDKLISDGYCATLTFSATEVYPKEPIIAELRVFSTSVLESLTHLELPAFNDFLVWQLSSREVKIDKERIGDVEFLSALIGRMVLIPLRPGNLNIEKSVHSLTVSTRLEKISKNPFDTFFDPAPIETIMLQTDPTVIHVKDFPPNIPPGFSNTVGRSLTVMNFLNRPEFARNKPFTIEMEVFGNANLKFLSPPELKLPPQIELIDIEIYDHSKVDKDGVHGSKGFSYIVKAKTSGPFEIPGTAFSFFNLETEEYQTVSSDPISLYVFEGDPDVCASKFSSQVQSEDKRREVNSAQMFVLDVSGSMLAKDFSPNRQSAVFASLMKCLEQSVSDIGIVVFSEIPYLLHPVSMDKETVIDSLKNFTFKYLGNGSSSGMAIIMAIDEVVKSNAKNKSIVLVTDGKSNSGSIRENLAVEVARHFDIPVNIIGVGSDAENAPYTIKTAFGEQETEIAIGINDQELSHLALSSNGEYFRVTNSDELVEAIDYLSTQRSKKSVGSFKPVYTKSDLQSILELMNQEVAKKTRQEISYGQR